MKWAGYWIMAVAALHMVAAIFLFGGSYVDMMLDGLWGSADTELRKLAVWFAIASPMMFIIGISVLNMTTIPLLISLLLGSIAVIGAILIPISGFWMLIPPAIGLLIGNKPNPKLTDRELNKTTDL